MQSSQFSARRSRCNCKAAGKLRPTFGHASRASMRFLAQRFICRATEAEAETTSAETPAKQQSEPKDDSWVEVMPPEELPKGVRKEVSVNGQNVLLFWYRNAIYAISSRSPAEGAYSEGFIKAKFTQDYGIICPTTGSVFSIKDGSIIDWYPSNPVLRAIMPKSASLPVFPVKLTQDAILVSIDTGSTGAMAPTRGGADTSLENNNVFAIQPSVYVEGSDSEEGDTSSGALSTTLTLTVAITCFGIVATAGTATALFYEDYILLGGFWALMLAVGGYFGWQFLQSRQSGSQ